MPEDITEKPSTVEATPEKDLEAPSQDPVKAELEKEQRKGGKSEAEKAAFSLQKNAERLKELGGDPEAVLGFKTKVETPIEDDAPLTVGMYKKIEADRSQRTALQLAEDITDPNERELAKHYLQTRVVPSGDPQADLRFALAAVNSVKNTQIVEEINRKGPGGHSSGTGGPSKRAGNEFIPTAEETAMMKPPFNLSKEKIIEARDKNEKAQQ